MLDKLGRDAVGAMVGVNVSGKQMWRVVNSAAGYLSGHEPHVHFGVGKDQQVSGIEVIWPDGTRANYPASALGNTIRRE